MPEVADDHGEEQPVSREVFSLPVILGAGGIVCVVLAQLFPGALLLAALTLFVITTVRIFVPK